MRPTPNSGNLDWPIYCLPSSHSVQDETITSMSRDLRPSSLSYNDRPDYTWSMQTVLYVVTIGRKRLAIVNFYEIAFAFQSLNASCAGVPNLGTSRYKSSQVVQMWRTLGKLALKSSRKFRLWTTISRKDKITCNGTVKQNLASVYLKLQRPINTLQAFHNLRDCYFTCSWIQRQLFDNNIMEAWPFPLL